MQAALYALLQGCMGLDDPIRVDVLQQVILFLSHCALLYPYDCDSVCVCVMWKVMWRKLWTNGKHK